MSISSVITSLELVRGLQTSTTQDSHRPWSSGTWDRSNFCLTDTNKSAKPACMTIQNRMEGIHLADLETWNESEANLATCQPVPYKQFWNSSWCLILDPPWCIFDAARSHSGLKSFRMPKYNTVHDFFPYLYLFRRNPIFQSLNLHYSSKLYADTVGRAPIS